MKFKQSDEGAVSQQKRNEVSIREGLRDLRNQLASLNQRVGTRLELKGIELDCLDLIARFGPINPGNLARQANLHPATLTGILDRLERDGWIARDRDPSDRRAITVRVLRERGAAVFGLYSGMNARIDTICADYTADELELLASFLRRVTDAGREATEELTER
jgi:DNA-binding MarR family transcriptional regulator